MSGGDASRETTGSGTSGDGELFEFLDDLEARAAAAHRRERAQQVKDRARSAYGEVTLESRLMASIGRTLSCSVRGVGRIQGTLVRVGAGWLLLEAGSDLWYVQTPAVRSLRGASERAVPEQVWTKADRLGFASALRRLSDEAATCMVHLDDESRVQGSLGRVGADFVEVVAPGVSAAPGTVELVRISDVVAVRAAGGPERA